LVQRSTTEHDQHKIWITVQQIIRRSTKFGKKRAEICKDLQLVYLFIFYCDETKLPQFGSISQIEIQFFIAYPPLNINRYL